MHKCMLAWFQFRMKKKTAILIAWTGDFIRFHKYMIETKFGPNRKGVTLAASPPKGNNLVKI